MTNNTLPARDVAFLTALAEYLLASGSDRAADALISAIRSVQVRRSDVQQTVDDLNRRHL